MLTKPLLPRTLLRSHTLHLSRPRTSLITPHPSTSLLTTSTPTSSTQTTRAASTTSTHAADEHGHTEHESHYDPPGGWLWGIRPGEKYEKEGWEGIFIYGFFGSVIVAGIAYAFKPDTSIQTWALEEARRRLEREGVLEDPNPTWKPSDGKDSAGKQM